jgi:hypothetical protein
MTTLEMNGDWNLAKGKSKPKWAKLANKNLRFAQDKQEELLGLLQKSMAEARKTFHPRSQ